MIERIKVSHSQAGHNEMTVMAVMVHIRMCITIYKIKVRCSIEVPCTPIEGEPRAGYVVWDMSLHILDSNQCFLPVYQDKETLPTPAM